MKIFCDLRDDSLRNSRGTNGSERNRVLLSGAKGVLAFASSRGGCGKSALVTNIAATLALGGSKVGILDGDLNAPSIPAMLGLKPFRMLPALGGIEPASGPLGLRVVASSLIPDDEPPPISFIGEESDAALPPVPVIPFELDYRSTLIRMAAQVRFGEVDIVLIDLAPGLDHLYRAANCIELSGIVLVSQPSALALRGIRDAAEIAGRAATPVAGLVENMIGFSCDSCHSVRPLFPLNGNPGVQTAILGRLPFDPRLAECSDRGVPFVKQYPDVPAAKLIAELAKNLLRTATANVSANATVDAGRP